MFRLAGQNPSVKELVYIPKPGGPEWTHPVLRPGMDGFNGPPTLEPIKPYNPSEDKSEFIPLELAHSHERVHKHRWNPWPGRGYKNDPTFIDLEYRPGWREGHPNGPKELEELIPYDPKDDRGREIEYLAESKDMSGGGSSLVSGPAPQSEFDRLLTINPQAAYKHVQKNIAELEAAGTRAQVVADLLYPPGSSPVFAGQNPAVGALIKDMFKPFDIVKGKGGSPGQPYGGDGQEPYWPRPTPTPQPTPKAMKNGLNEKIANLVAALRLNG